MKNYLALMLFFFLCLSGTAAHANLSKEQIDSLTNNFASRNIVDFDDFLQQVTVVAATNIDMIATINRYQQNRQLDDEDNALLARLLGIYTRGVYGSEAIQTLQVLVAIPTFRVDGLPQHDNPEFHRFATVLEEIAISFDLQFRNIDNRIYEITLPGDSDDTVGIHAHADVVPVNPELWVLEDGTQLDPFQVTLIGNRLYGRGTEDDKNGIVVSLYAMRVIKEENLTLLRNIRLLVDTTEETSSEAIPYYFSNNPTPDYNIALDGSYPVVIAEKGYGTVEAHFPVRSGSGEGAEIITLSGGLASNQIPAAATAGLNASNPAQLIERLNVAGRNYVVENGEDFQIRISQLDLPAANTNADSMVAVPNVLLTVEGTSAHSSEPQNGVNPVSRLLDFLHAVHEQGMLQSNHLTDAAEYASHNWGLDYYGNQLDIAYSHDFMGPLTAALTYVGLNAQELVLTVNLRLPVGRTPSDLLSELDNKLRSWRTESGTDVEFAMAADEPMYRDPEGAWVNALLDIATESLALPRQFGSSAGATSVHDLPNGVQFGLSMPAERYSGHNANEFKRVDQFLLDLQIVTEMFSRLGRMSSL